MSQYEQFLSVSNFELAYTRLKTAPRNLYKSIYYDDLRNFGLFLDDNILNTINHIKQGIYQPEKCHKIFIPKKDNLVRPLSMLSFIDLLVYQALVNTIADYSYEVISPYYNSVIFGNIVNISKANKNDRKFFFKPWKQRWKRFNDVSKEFYADGYKYLSEFDIASFFDTIDHNILCELLRNVFKVEDEILQLLCQCLEAWTQDSNHKSFKSKHGIPQGPLASPFLADLYLFYLDNEIRSSKKLTFRYVRYVDDIRLFTKDKLTSQKLIALLDLVSRDLGLIPQGSKIVIKEIEDIDKELKIQNSKFSDINKEFNKETDGKPTKQLTSKTHKRLKKRFINCFNDKSEERYLDKTLIAFALYKLNKDDEVKNLLLDKYHLILSNFESVLFYFSKHYNTDNAVINFCVLIIRDENILFHYLVALVFKYFPHIPFDEEVYARYNFQTHRHWLVNFYMVQWLFENDKKDVLLMSGDADNHFIRRQINLFRFISMDDSTSKKLFSSRLLYEENSLTAIQGLNFLFSDPFTHVDLKADQQYNDYIRFIITRQPANIIHHTLKRDWGVDNPEIFFNSNIWADERVYEEVKSSFSIFYQYKNIDPSKSLLNLNNFNNLLFDKICEILSIDKRDCEYGSCLSSNFIETQLPICNQYWKIINERRNQNSEAHPYDRTGGIRIKIKHQEFIDLIQKQKQCMKELCSSNLFEVSKFSVSYA